MNDYERVEFGRVFLPLISWMVDKVNQMAKWLLRWVNRND